MGFDTKPNFNSNKFEQCAGDIMNLSGCTQIYSTLDMESGSTLSVSNGAIVNITTDSGIDKILRSDASGDGTWIEIPVKDAVNALTLTDGTVLLGGSLIQETDIDLNSALFKITNQNPPFMIGTGFDETVTNVVEDADGKYVVAGRFHEYSGVTANGLIRLFPDGTVDTSLDIGDGFWKSDGSTAISAMVLDADGKILVAGSFTLYDNVSHPNLVRLNTDGTYDTTFTPPTDSTLDGGRVIYVKNNGKILMGGDFNKHLLQLNDDGTVDTGFVVGTGFAGGQTGPSPFTFVLAIKEQNNGQLIIGGDYTSYSGISAGHIIRLYPDGRYDSSFDTSPGFNRRVRTISIQSDGNIVLGGEFTGYTDSTFHNSSGIARLDSDGTYDDTFLIGDGFTGNTGIKDYHIGVQHIIKQVNNQYIILGYFTWYDGTAVGGIARLDSDAVLDTSFESGTGFNAVPSTAIVTSGGKFMIGGNFTSYSGVSYTRLIRLSYYGDIDNQSLDSEIIFNGKVIEYGGNYESHYTNRSLVDKEYVDSQVSGATSGTTATSGENVTLGIAQSSHGLAVNDFIGWSGSTYNKAIADGNYDGEFVGLVSDVPDANSFCVTQSGYVTGLTASFAANTTYWLSEGTAGLLTSTEPTGDGEISKAAFMADTTSSGWVLPYAGVVVSTGATSISTADNGLTDNGGIVQLGGTLCQNTEIDTSTFNLSISNLPAQTDEETVLLIGTDGVIVTGASTSGCGDYAGNSPATCNVGGITSGTVLTGQTLEYLIQEMLAPYIEPTFNSFTSASISSPMEVGAALSGTKTFNWATTTCDNVAVNTIGICEVGGALLGSGLANDYAEALDIGTKTNNDCCVWTWQITGCSTQNTAFSRNMTKYSVYPYFWGVETCGTRPAVDSTLVNGGTKVVSSVSSSASIDFNSVGQWTWFAMPSGCTSRSKWFQGAAPNCGDIAVSPVDKYPDECILSISDTGGCWSAVGYKVYMSESAGTSGTTPIEFRTY